MRVLIVQTWYPAFLSSFYEDRPRVVDEPYEAQRAALMESFFGLGDACSHYLNALGHVADELVVNCEPLQRRWAEEHGFSNIQSTPFSTELSDDILLAQVEAFAPDVVYVLLHTAVSTKTLEKVRRPGRLVAGQLAARLPPSETLTPYDLMVTSFPHFVPLFEERGIAGHYLRLAFDPRILARLGETEQTHRAVFVGGLGRAWHGPANEILAEAARRAPIDFWGYGERAWSRWSPVRRRFHGEAWGLQMYRILAEAKISLNRHIDIAQGYSNNLRLYDATGVGSLLLTEHGRNLETLFEPDRELVTYSSAADLADKIRYYLDHEDERLAISQAGQARTLRDHTWADRMKELAEIFARELG